MKFVPTASVLLALLTLPLVAQAADPVVNQINIDCSVPGSVNAECVALDADGDLDTIEIRIYSYPTQTDCNNQTNGTLRASNVFDINSTAGATRDLTANCVPGLWYKALAIVRDDANNSASRWSACCQCEAAVAPVPTISEVGLAILFALLLGGGVLAIRRA